VTLRRPHTKRWVVREGDGQTVAEIVKRAGEQEHAVEEGRVFVGRRRVKSGQETVKAGDEVTIGAAKANASSAPGVAEWSVIWEKDELLACFKPAGMPTVPDHAGASHALVARAAASVGLRASDLFVTSRLDREVSGVVVFATSLDAEARLKHAREQGRYARRYVAIASGSLGVQTTSPGAFNVWDAPIGRGKDPRHRAALGPDAKAATTHWTAVSRAGGFALLAVEPQTGRTHQIRVHASHAGAPLLGDRDYGGPTRATLPGGRVVALARIALHAARVTVPDARGEPLVAAAPVPAELLRAWTDLGGASEAWDMAASCVLER
jgi:23S rRNA pseudouridine1911/1915/1917 synthase